MYRTAGEADRVQPAEEPLGAAAACNSRANPRREQRGARQQGGHVALQSTGRRDQTRRAGLLQLSRFSDSCTCSRFNHSYIRILYL